MTKSEAFIHWLFTTPCGKATGIFLVPFGLSAWLLISLVIGEDLFDSNLWKRLENRQ